MTKVIKIWGDYRPSYSLNENLVPEQLFDNPDTPEKEADGISATKALSFVAQQGQTIYTVTKANYAEVLLKLNHSDVVMTDIRNGMNAGKTVTVHDTQITLNGWKVTGYTILDPNTGAGAYMIGGGLDGGATQGLDEWKSVFGLLNYYLVTPAKLFLKLPLNPLRNTLLMLTGYIDAVKAYEKCGWTGAAFAFAIATLAIVTFLSMMFVVGALVSAFALPALLSWAIGGVIISSLGRVRKDAIGAFAC